MQPKKAVLLDVSGVLRDNRRAMWDSYLRVLRQAGFDLDGVLGADAQSAYRLRGFSKYNLVENCIEALWALQQERVALADALAHPETIDAAVSRHSFSEKKTWAMKVKADFRRTDAAYLASVPPIPHAHDALQRLSASYELAVVSNSGSVFNKAWLDAHGFSRFFRTFVAEQDVLHKKPYPEGILLACRRLFFQPEQCYYVGDAQSDMAAALAAGAVPVGVLSGTATLEQLEQAGAWRVFDDVWQVAESFCMGPVVASRGGPA
ncbi:HAD family hydrolase [Candidatus Micrarchaeota archaeon]|nr:HAD family hydrolase [Candidatus Micrarchaeota archaeon]